MKLFIDENGVIQLIYTDNIDLSEWGDVKIQRASHVEPDENGLWYVDLTPVGGIIHHGFKKRQEALDFEVQWLLNNHFIK